MQNYKNKYKATAAVASSLKRQFNMVIRVSTYY